VILPLKVLVIFKLNLVKVNFFLISIFGDASLKFGDEPINLVMNKCKPGLNFTKSHFFGAFL
jgi:hypothetical protein